MNTRQKFANSVLIAVVAGVSAVAGAWVSGWHLIKSQKMQQAQALEIMTGANAQEELNVIRDKSYKYFCAVCELVEYIKKPEFEENEIMRLLKSVNETGYELLFYVPKDFALASLKLNSKLMDAIKSIGKESFSSNIEKVDETQAEWLKAYIRKVSRYQSYSIPSKHQTDLLIQILKSMSVIER